MKSPLSNHDDIISAWVEASPSELNFPPPCFYHMEGEMIEWNPEKKTLVARYPTKTEFQNPRQFMQGGFVVAALDNTLGPLSYLSGAPSVTMQLNTTYIRPVAPHYHYIEVFAAIDEITTSKVYSSAQARSPEGKLLSTVQALSHVVK